MDQDKPQTKIRVVRKFGPVLYCTVAGVVAGFSYACATSWLLEGAADYWFPAAAHYSCLGAIVGLFIGIVRDCQR
jgi:hypothetical protein